MWDQVEVALGEAEMALQLPQYFIDPDPKSKSAPAPCPMYNSALHSTLAAHILILGVVYYAHLGQSASSQHRLGCLHVLLDAMSIEGTQEASLDGSVDVGFLSLARRFSLVLNSCTRFLWKQIEQCTTRHHSRYK
jgi:hypothetical protein